jgi:hypothetical protein
MDEDAAKSHKPSTLILQPRLFDNVTSTYPKF